MRDVDCGLWGVGWRPWIGRIGTSLLTVHSRQATAYTYLAHVFRRISPEQAVPQSLGALTKRCSADLTKLVALGEMFDGYYDVGGHWESCSLLVATLLVAQHSIRCTPLQIIDKRPVHYFVFIPLNEQQTTFNEQRSFDSACSDALPT